jgi:hypothetical protein
MTESFVCERTERRKRGTVDLNPLLPLRERNRGRREEVEGEQEWEN